MLLTAAIAAVVPKASFAQTRPADRAAATTRATPTIRERIDETLRRDGTLDGLAAELNSAQTSDTRPLSDLAAVFLEQGDLAHALATFRSQAAAAPADAALLRRIASAEEKLGDVGLAQGHLRTALDLTKDATGRASTRLRMALLAFDDGRDAEGVRLLDDAAAEAPAVAAQAGAIAYLAGQYAATARLIGQAPGNVGPALTRLAGNAELRVGNVAGATRAFDAALAGCRDPQDQRYTQERIIAAARQAGKLSTLADAWLARVDLPTERYMDLAGILRESGRVPELLSWWRKRAAEPGATPALSSVRFVNEVIGAAQEAGLTDEAEQVARGLLTAHPDDDRLLAAALRLLLNHRKPADADALLAARVAASADRPDALERLARLGRSLGRDAVAVTAARTMRTFGGLAEIHGLLLEASVDLRAGETDVGVGVLHVAMDAAMRHPEALGDVATACEAAGREADAIELLRASARRSPDDETLERLSALLVRQRRFPEASLLLQTLRVHGSSVAVRAQAGQRLLDIAFAEHRADRLIADTRAAIDSGTATEADLSLLAEAYIRTNNAEAAAELLKHNTLLDRGATLSKLAVIFLRVGDLTQASATLRELVSADPTDAVATLEQLAAVELQRRQPRAAAEVVNEIAARIGKSSESFNDLMGGLYDRLNRTAQAVPFYRRALADHPESAETWLLWSTAMSKTGSTEMAIGRMGVLCDEVRSDSALAVAVDGLLNLKAPAAALRAARRDAILRATAGAQSSASLQVVGDLSDELRDRGTVIRAIEVGVALDREARPQLLRELAEAAIGAGELDEANACARSMLALGEDFPPDTLLQLGERFIVAGRLKDASSAFARAAEMASDDQVAPRAADLLEQYGSPRQALAIFSPFAERKPYDLSSRQTTARLQELAGHTPEAFEDDLAALGLADREIAKLPSGPTPLDVTPPPRPDLTAIVNGAIATARTPAQRKRLLDDLADRVSRQFSATPADASPPDRFFQMLGELRRAGFAFDRADFVDAIDARLIGQRPDLKMLPTAALAARLERGMFDSASEFAARFHLTALLPARLRIGLADASPATAPSTTPSRVTAEDGALLLPRLLVTGQIERARQVLHAIPPFLPTKPPETMPTLISAAVALGEDEWVTEWAERWATQIVALPPTTAASRPTLPSADSGMQGLRNFIDAVWRILPDPARVAVARQALAFSDRSVGGPNASNAATLALRLTAEAHVDVPNRIDLALRLIPSTRPTQDQRTARVADLAARMDWLPAADHPTFVERAVAQLPKELGLAFLQKVVERSGTPIDARTGAAMVTASKNLPDGQTLLGSKWFTNSAYRPILTVLAAADESHGLRHAPALGQIVMPDVADAVALSYDEPDKGGRMAVEAIRRLLAAVPAPEPADDTPGTPPATKPATSAVPPAAGMPAGESWVTLARYAAAVIPKDLRSQLLASPEIAAGYSADVLPARRAKALLVRSILLDAAGRRDAALDALRDAYALGENPEIWQAYLDRLVQDGRSAELAEAFATTAPQRMVREPLATALRSLFRGREVTLPNKAVGLSATTPRRVLDFMTPWALVDRDKLGETLRMFLERLRSNIDGVSPIVEADPAGMPLPDHVPGEILGDLGRWPGAVDDLLATFRALPQGRLAAKTVVDLLAKAAVDPEAARTIIEALSASARAGTLTLNDRQLVSQLAVLPNTKLPPVLVDAVRAELLLPDGGGDYRLVSDGLRAQGDPHSGDAERWASIRSPAASPPAAFDLSEFRARIDAALDARAWSQLNRPTRYDACVALPSAVVDPAQRSDIADVMEQALDRAALRWPGDPNWTRSMASLGRWCQQHGDADRARRILDRGTALGESQGSGEHLLWIADLATLLNRPELARRIQFQLLESRCLPATRIPALLKSLTDNGDVETAQRLASKASAYCSEPNVLGMAADKPNER